jgi:hypothetical protein
LLFAIEDMVARSRPRILIAIGGLLVTILICHTFLLLFKSNQELMRQMTFNDLSFGAPPVRRSSIAQAIKAHEPGVPTITPEPIMEQQIEQQQKPNPAMMREETVVLLIDPRTTREKKIAENDTNLEEREKKAEETAMSRSKETEVDKSTSIIISQETLMNSSTGSGDVISDMSAALVHNPVSDMSAVLIHNPAILKMHKKKGNQFIFTIPPSMLSEVCAGPGKGAEQEQGYELLTKKIVVASYLDHQGSVHAPRVFCSIYTYSKNRPLVEAIIGTYGSRCDGFLAASDTHYVDPSKGVMHIKHKGSDGTYGSIWQKVRSMFTYLHDNFLNDFDFFHIGGDDMVVIPSNLRAFLASPKILEKGGGIGWPEPLYIGQWIAYHKDYRKPPNATTWYHGGGSGYTINRAALRKLVASWNKTECNPNIDKSAEDLYMGQCMQSIGINALDGTDGLHQQTYHGFDPQFVHEFRPGMRGRVGNFWTKNLRRKHEYLLLQGVDYDEPYGMDAASNLSVSFHLIKTAAFHWRLNQILYDGIDGGQCANFSKSNV